jgi:hypothetical protein
LVTGGKVNKPGWQPGNIAWSVLFSRAAWVIRGRENVAGNFLAVCGQGDQSVRVRSAGA